MGLSEREQKLFEQLERELAGDAEFVGKVDSARNSARGGKLLVLGVLTLLVGVGLLILAVIWQVAFLGVTAFVVMLIGLVTASSNFSAPSGSAGEPGSPKAKTDKGSFFEDRWNRRFGE